jgi:hypothetical protein
MRGASTDSTERPARHRHRHFVLRPRHNFQIGARCAAPQHLRARFRVATPGRVRWHPRGILFANSIFSIAPSHRDPVQQVTLAELWAKYTHNETVQLRQVTPVKWKTKLGNTQQVMYCVKDYSSAEHRVPCATKLVGVLNITSDSFSGDGLAKNSNDMREVTAAAVTLARSHVAGGADLLEVGGESTRPGSDPVPSDVELTRVTRVIAALRDDASLDNVPIVVDTVKVSATARMHARIDRSIRARWHVRPWRAVPAC